jgi:sulfoxide reductase heme-binding subunit YedZ
MTWLKHNWHYTVAHTAGILPLAALALNYLQDYLADPIRYLMLRTGSIGLILLVASFACTPVSTLLGWRQAVQIRRPLGVYSVIYISLHLLIYAAWENGWELELIVRDLGERQAMFIGLAAFALLIPLALTSTHGWQRRLGKGWRRLHRLVYIAVPLAALHFYWLDRDIKDLPLAFGVVIVVLLILRLPPIRRTVIGARLRLAALR